MRRLAALAVVATVVAMGAAVGVRVEHVHEVTGQWGLVVKTATPARISVLGRSYDRSGAARSASVSSGFVSGGRTTGGGTILVPADGEGTPLIIYVRDRQGGIWTYGLVGGP